MHLNIVTIICCITYLFMYQFEQNIINFANMKKLLLCLLLFPIQVENLILRNKGIQLFRNGTDHAPLNEFIPNFMSLPNFR